MRILTFVVLGAAWAACGGSANTPPPDAAPTADASDVDAASACTRLGFLADTRTAERDDELGVLFYTARTAADPHDRLTLDFYFGLGASDGAQTVVFDGEDLATCTVCMTARVGCSGISCDTAYLAQSGTAEITAMGAVGTSFTGTLTDVVLAEATIGVDGDGNVSATLVPDGDVWCVDSHGFDVPITDPI